MVQNNLWSKAKGSSSMFSLIVFFIICSLLFIFISIKELQNTTSQKIVTKIECFDNLDLADSILFNCGLNNFSSKYGVTGELIPWGIFDYWSSQCTIDSSFSENILVGIEVLSVPNLKVDELKVEGSVELRGTVCLRSQKVGYSHISSYQRGASIIELEYLQNCDDNVLDLMSVDITNRIEEMDLYLSMADSIYTINNISKSIYMDYGRSPAVVLFQDSGHYAIDGVNWKGNIYVSSNGTIFIGNNTVLEGVVIRAKNVIIEAGADITAQIFAEQSIIVQSNATLHYPSAIVIGKQVTNKATIDVGENVIIEGFLLACGNGVGNLNLQKNAIIRGMVYSEWPVHFKSEVQGYIHVKSFQDKIAGGSYENVLTDAKVIPLVKPFPFSLAMVKNYTNHKLVAIQKI